VSLDFIRVYDNVTVAEAVRTVQGRCFAFGLGGFGETGQGGQTLRSAMLQSLSVYPPFRTDQ
jgi:hypothetical protein